MARELTGSAMDLNVIFPVNERQLARTAPLADMEFSDVRCASINLNFGCLHLRVPSRVQGRGDDSIIEMRKAS